MLTLRDLEQIYTENEQEILSDWFTFLSFKSISSEKEFISETKACLDWLRAYLTRFGFQTEVWETEGHPILFAKTPKEKKEAPTLLFYNHYDVQPVDPKEEWKTPPFTPTIKDGEVYARGAQDNKGQALYTILALGHLLKKDPEVHLNIKLLIEGEEEIGSDGLSKILPEKKEALKADALIITDVLIPAPDTPAITLGVRGILTFDVEVIGSNSDLHSGLHGGVVVNPLHALVEILSKLRSPKTGQILVPGFYEGMEELSEKEREVYDFSFDEEGYRKTFAAKPCGGETAFSPGERLALRPTLEINGIGGGYSGEGFKTVIPEKAVAKLSCRLVPGQDKDQIAKIVKAFLEDHCPKGIQIKVKVGHGGNGIRADADSDAVKSYGKAFKTLFGKEAKNVLSGASIPIAAELGQTLNLPVILTGLGLDSDNIHAPNEHFSLDRFKKGFLLTALAAQEFAHIHQTKEAPCES